MKNLLLGLWMTDPESDPKEIVTMEFKDDGQLIYTIMGKEKDSIILLTYCTEDGILITDQPSAPKKEKTKFSITPDGKLILIYGNCSQQYMRMPTPMKLPL